MTPPLYYKKVRKGAQSPTRDTEDSVGYDIKSPSPHVIKSKTTGIVPTGLAFDIPKGLYGRLAAKSQQACQYSLLVLGGVIDPGYTREVFVLLHVLGEEDFNIEEGQEFIQLILENASTPPLKEVKQMPPSTKRIKNYNTQVHKPAKRLTQPKAVKKTTIRHSKKYRLRGTKLRSQTVKHICNCYA